MPQNQSPMSAQRWLPAYNAGSNAIPAFGLVRITGINSDAQHTVTTPNANDQNNLAVNGPSDIPAGGTGSITRDFPTTVLYEGSDGTPANGEEWGAESGGHFLRLARSGWRIIGDASNGLVDAEPVALSLTSSSTVAVEEDDIVVSAAIATLNVVTTTGLSATLNGSQVDVDLAAAGAAQAGAVTTGAQTFAGSKTFNDDVHLSNGVMEMDTGSFTRYWEGTDTYPVTVACVAGSTGAIFRVQAVNAAGSDSTTLFWDYDNARLQLNKSTSGGTDPYIEIVNSTGTHTGATGTSGGGDTVVGGIITTLASSTFVDAEGAQDAVGGILTDTATIDFTYNDAGDQITADVITQMSVTSDASGVKLDGDAASPGNRKYYGSNDSGTKAWLDLADEIADAGPASFLIDHAATAAETTLSSITTGLQVAATDQSSAVTTLFLDATNNRVYPFSLASQPTYSILNFSGGTINNGDSATDGLGNIFLGGICVSVSPSGVLDEPRGGTGQSSFTTGDILYSSATDTLAKLAGNTTTAKQYLSQTGTGAASQAPAWSALSANDITLGTLGVGNGGTGGTNFTAGQLLMGAGSSPLTAQPPSANTWSTPLVSSSSSFSNGAWPGDDSTSDEGPSSHTVTGSWANVTGCTVSLSAGKWLIVYHARAELQISAGTIGAVSCRLYNSTDAAFLADSESIIHAVTQTGTYTTESGAGHAFVTLSGTKTIVLQALRHGGPTWTTSNLISGTEGRTYIHAIKVSYKTT